jgi:hypothetical protein
MFADKILKDAAGALVSDPRLATSETVHASEGC